MSPGEIRSALHALFVHATELACMECGKPAAQLFVIRGHDVRAKSGTVTLEEITRVAGVYFFCAEHERSRPDLHGKPEG